MMTLEEEAQSILSAFGQELEFQNGMIKALTEIDLSILSGESSVYLVEKQNFHFQAFLKDVVDNEIDID